MYLTGGASLGSAISVIIISAHPIFKEKNSLEISRVKKIIRSYYGQKIIFFLEGNQAYKNQYEVAPILQKKFFSSPQRKKDKIIYKKRNFNVAVHIRLGWDIFLKTKNPTQRYLNVDYFVHAASRIQNLYVKKVQFQNLQIWGSTVHLA